MVTHGRVELLAHPLSQKYLQMKWNSYGKYFHVTNLLIYTVFLMFVTIYASQLMECVNRDTSINRTQTNDTKEVGMSCLANRTNVWWKKKKKTNSQLKSYFFSIICSRSINDTI